MSGCNQAEAAGREVGRKDKFRVVTRQRDVPAIGPGFCKVGGLHGGVEVAFFASGIPQRKESVDGQKAGLFVEDVWVVGGTADIGKLLMDVPPAKFAGTAGGVEVLRRTGGMV